MRCFIDTSALLAVLDRSDRMHAAAAEVWRELLSDESTQLVTTNYVLLETAALVQSRMGFAALLAFAHDMSPALTPIWVDPPTHERGMAALLAQSRRRLSLVDCVSFEVMRALGIRHYLAYDEHFREQGFLALDRSSQNPSPGSSRQPTEEARRQGPAALPAPGGAHRRSRRMDR